MIPFLRQVAEKYYEEGGIDRKCFIFPNRRSMVFFRKYLSEAVAAGNSERPIFAPEMLTVNDFFYRMDNVAAVDKVTLLLELYECYKSLNPKAEPLDEFIFWGDVILGDFNDVDKYLVDPKRIFTNVSDFRSLQDTYSYLTENQRKAIESFVSHFNFSSGRLTVEIGSEEKDVRARFLRIWNILDPLYNAFRERLEAGSMSYEGMVYRSLADRLDTMPVADVLAEHFPGVGGFVFVGLNALNECEKKVMRKMRDASLAEFCWDYSGDLIKDPQNKSSFFMSRNVTEFPQKHEWDGQGKEHPEIKIISVPSAVGQVKRLPEILKRTGEDYSRCAVVLPDENLLMPLLNTIPEDIADINVTMGYPMRSSAFYSFMKCVSALQLHSREKNGSFSFYYRQVWDLFSNAVFRKVADDAVMERVRAVKAAAGIYVPQSELSGIPLLDLLFEPVVRDQKSADKDQIKRFAEYQLKVIGAVAPGLKEDVGMAAELEFAKEYYRGVSRLLAADLPVLPLTYIRLLDQVMAAVSVPFRGEPLKGLQIMGPLETRALDFEDVVIMSCNEGVFPRKSVSSSFIPPELRRGFGLPTYEYQDAVWAYYFYRLITRASRVWMLYDSRTDGLQSGEESRYIKQLVYHFRLPVERYVQETDTGEAAEEPPVAKTAEDMAVLKSCTLSASALQNYLACPVRFYYSKVKNLAPEAEVAESLDARMFGNVYHNLMWALYSGGEAMAVDFVTDKTRPDSGLGNPLKEVGYDYIEGWMKRKPEIKAKVMRLISDELKGAEVTGRNLVVADVIVRYVLKTLERELELLRKKGAASFRILGLEKKMTAEFGGFRFVGYIDRLDSVEEGRVRVSDYKSGRVQDNDMAVGDKVAELMFGEDNAVRPTIALQFFVYDMLLRANGYGTAIDNSVYSAVRLFANPVDVVPMDVDFYSAVEGKLEELLEEIADPAVPFRRTDDTDTCALCDFRAICGR